MTFHVRALLNPADFLPFSELPRPSAHRRAHD